MLTLDRLSLTDFRNYRELVWRRPARISVLTGPNGSGKTNLLEALSLLVPGRGLRSARLVDLPRLGSPHWAVAARLTHAGDPFEIGTGTTSQVAAGRRVFRLDGQPARNRAAVAEHLCAVWLTPQMDRLFVEGLSGRRRFLDRLVLALEPDHARQVAAHDEALQGRRRLLQGGATDPAWLAGLEHSQARHAVAVSAARRSLVARMNAQNDTPGHRDTQGFPPAFMALDCPIAARLETEPALAVEDWLRRALEASRRTDAAAGSSVLGAHRADLRLSDLGTGLPAALGSTGQQKALLIGVVLSHAALIAAARGEAPLLLLDEPLVHLDVSHRAALFRALLELPAPVLLTGTDPEPFAPLADDAEILGVEAGKLGVLEAFPWRKAGSGGACAI